MFKMLNKLKCYIIMNNNITLGKIIDKGILSTVYECKYKNRAENSLYCLKLQRIG